ncbi:MAG TPA: HAMP domain-containing protein, partial [Desulfobacteria bacterium]|nr:HAMP domain-containing protein [Desulfobacteria bacterium]
MFKSIRWRLTAIFFVVTALFLFLLGIYLMNTMEKYAFNNLQNNLLSYARLMSDDLSVSFASHHSRDDFQRYAKKVSGDINARVTIIATDGTVLGDSLLDKDSMANHANRPEVKSAINGKIGKSVRFSTSLNQKLFYFASPVKERDKVVGVVRVAIPWKEIESSRNYIRTIIISSMIIAFILMVMVASAFTANMVVPLQEMTNAARELAEGKMNMTINVTTDDEIGALGRGLNYMSLRLQDTISEITHERNKVQAVLTSMTDGVIAIDKNGNIIMINPAVERLFNIKYEKSVGKSLIEVVRNFDLEKILHEALNRETGIT